MMRGSIVINCILFVCVYFFFFFKQKTAYEMRISDWSSDVCSSDLGRNIIYTLPVAPWEAALGATISVPTLGGKVELKIPAGSKAGRKLRLRGRGLDRKSVV